MDSVRLARIIATGAHYMQVDKGGHDYILHPTAVAAMVHTDDEKTVAWLHDVVEDTEITLKDLLPLFGIRITMAVDAITKRKGESRKEYLIRVKCNKIAKKVKIADLIHNSMISRIPCPNKEDEERCNRYQKEIEYLYN